MDKSGASFLVGKTFRSFVLPNNIIEVILHLICVIFDQIDFQPSIFKEIICSFGQSALLDCKEKWISRVELWLLKAQL